MPRPLLEKLLRLVGGLAVLAILGFLTLPALVVVLAAFNDSVVSLVSVYLALALICEVHRKCNSHLFTANHFSGITL